MSPASNSLTEERYDDVVYLPRRKERLLWRALLRVATEVLADWSYRHYTTAGTDGVRSPSFEALRDAVTRKVGLPLPKQILGTGEVGRSSSSSSSSSHASLLLCMTQEETALARSTKHGECLNQYCGRKNC